MGRSLYGETSSGRCVSEYHLTGGVECERGPKIQKPRLEVIVASRKFASARARKFRLCPRGADPSTKPKIQYPTNPRNWTQMIVFVQNRLTKR